MRQAWALIDVDGGDEVSLSEFVAAFYPELKAEELDAALMALQDLHETAEKKVSVPSPYLTCHQPHTKSVPACTGTSFQGHQRRIEGRQ